jgi:hypothetical protein
MTKEKRAKAKARLKRLTWRGLRPSKQPPPPPPPPFEAEDVTNNEKRREGRICCGWKGGRFGGGFFGARGRAMKKRRGRKQKTGGEIYLRERYSGGCCDRAVRTVSEQQLPSALTERQWQWQLRGSLRRCRAVVQCRSLKACLPSQS